MIKKLRNKITLEIDKFVEKLRFKETGGANLVAEIKVKKYKNASERYSWYGGTKIIMECMDEKGKIANFMIIRKKSVEEAKKYFENIKEGDI